MIQEQLSPPATRAKGNSVNYYRLLVFGRYVNRVLILVAVALLVYGLAWNYSTRRYLSGFSDAIVPLEGSPEEKSEALLGWLRHEPARRGPPVGSVISRDPVSIVQDTVLLKICGSASNAFINLADAGGLRTRRLLLLDASGGTKHVVVEVKWGERWVVVDPSYRLVFRDHTGNALNKEDLLHPEIFRDAISRMPGYKSLYSFERTTHIHLARIPFAGNLLQQALNFLFPRWEEAVNWGYFIENPSVWPMLASLPLLTLGIFIRRVVHRYGRDRLGTEPIGLRKRLTKTGRVFLHRSA